MQLTADILEDYDTWKNAQDYPEKTPEAYLKHLSIGQQLINWANVVNYIDIGIYDGIDANEVLVSIRADLMQDV